MEGISRPLGLRWPQKFPVSHKAHGAAEYFPIRLRSSEREPSWEKLWTSKEAPHQSGQPAPLEARWESRHLSKDSVTDEDCGDSMPPLPRSSSSATMRASWNLPKTSKKRGPKLAEPRTSTQRGAGSLQRGAPGSRWRSNLVGALPSHHVC